MILPVPLTSEFEYDHLTRFLLLEVTPLLIGIIMHTVALESVVRVYQVNFLEVSLC